jgi:glycosyltransferase involved in cell wall biosynthesis
MTPLISVVMPVRDGARWLGEAITSVQAQTLANFELIIIDDGSADDSPCIMEASARSDPRIHTIRQGRRGLVPALNRGLAESRGRFIARLDADDRAHPERLQRQSQYLDSHPEVGLLGTWAHKIDEQGSIRGALKPPTRPEQLAPLLARANPFVHPSIMVRKTIIQNVGYYRPAFEGAEDYDLWMRISEVTKIANLPKCLLQYRMHPASVTHTARLRQLFSARLVQRAALARRTTVHDPTSELTAPPNWRTPEFLSSQIYGDLARLFRFLDFADTVDITGKNGDDISVLSDRNIVLNHAERRIAQLALLTLLKRGGELSETNRAVLLWHFIRLHPLRALQFGYQALSAQKHIRSGNGFTIGDRD